MSGGLPSRTSAVSAAPTLAHYTSAPLSGFHEAADAGVAARQRPDDEAERPVLAHLCVSEHFHKTVPVMLSLSCGAARERCRRLRTIRRIFLYPPWNDVI